MEQILSSDLHGRVGYFRVKNEKILTPTLLPVVDPKYNVIPPNQLYSEYGFNLLITSAYLYFKRFGHPHGDTSIHDILDFPGKIMMDSGAYQLLVYGDVDIQPLESLNIQASLMTDIGVILDVPISLTDNLDVAKTKVNETINRVKQSIDFVNKHTDIIWTLPIQGGRYLDLLSYYVDEITRHELHKPFKLYALGSVAPLMSQYDYLTLFSMIYRTRSILPHNIPLHLFGAGHPMIFPFIVALGCDTFDSAAYILFAKEGRYITPNATYKLNDLSEFPCVCPICNKWTPKELSQAEPEIRTELLARHNLYVSSMELKKIRLAITNGRLWELLELKAKSHPKLYQAFVYIINNFDNSFWEEFTPVTKFFGIKINNDLSTYRPEFSRLKKRIFNNYIPNSDRLTIFVLSGFTSPIELISKRDLELDDISRTDDLFFFLPFFGLIPLELAESYPFSQFVFSGILSKPKIKEILDKCIEFVLKNNYKTVSVEPLEANEDCKILVEEIISSFKTHAPQIHLQY